MKNSIVTLTYTPQYDSALTSSFLLSYLFNKFSMYNSAFIQSFNSFAASVTDLI